MKLAIGISGIFYYKNNEIVCCSPYVDYRESIHLFKKNLLGQLGNIFETIDIL